MKHSNVFYKFLSKKNRFEAVKEAVAVRNRAGLDLFRIDNKLYEGQTGCLIAACSTKSEMEATVQRITSTQESIDRAHAVIQAQLEKTPLSPRYTRPDERREDLFPAPPKDKTILARSVGDIQPHKYTEVYNGDFSLFMLQTELTNQESYGASLYLLYDGWMINVGYADQREKIIEKLSAGIPDYRKIMQDEVEAAMSDPNKWCNVGYAAFFDRLDEARTHNQVIRDIRSAERAAEQAEQNQKEAERQAREEAAYREAIAKAEAAIVNHQPIMNAEVRGTSLILQLFRENGVKLPLRTQGWVKSALHSMDYNKARGCWNYRFFRSHKDSTTFLEYFGLLEQAIQEKEKQQGLPPPAVGEDLESAGDEWGR